jgi:hypothetical protein
MIELEQNSKAMAQSRSEPSLGAFDGATSP